MEKPNANKNNDHNFRWSVHGTEPSHKQRNDITTDKFWEDQWEGWASLAESAHAMDHFTPSQTYPSPSASESSFSVSTRDSTSLSAPSEASPIASKYPLQSSDLPQGRKCRIGLFYHPDVKHAKCLPLENDSRKYTETEKQQDGMLSQERGVSESIQHASDLNASALLRKKLESFVKAQETLLVQSSIGVSDEEDWLSDGTESWASASSRELSVHTTCTEANDVPSSVLYERPDIPHCYEQGETEWGAKGLPGHATRSRGFTNQDDNENAGVSDMQAYAEPNDEITPCDNEGSIQASISTQSMFDRQSGATALAHSGQFSTHIVPDPHAQGLVTRYFDRYKSLHSPGREADASCRIDADGLINDYQEPPVQAAGDRHQPFAHDDLLNVENITSHSQEENDFDAPFLTGNRSSTYMESASRSKQAPRLKSRHSAAVEHKYPSSYLHGHFRLVEQDGFQCYSFSVHDSDQVLFARATGQPENEEVCDHSYAFLSRREAHKTKGGRKTSLKKEKVASTLVGKMTVSGAKCVLTDDGCVEETRFVLYGERSQLPKEYEANKDHPISDHHDSSFSMPIFSFSKSELSKPTLNSHSEKFRQRNDGHMAVSGATASQGSVKFSREEQLELAALVITTTAKEYMVTSTEAQDSSHDDGPGWGVAFLEKRFKRGLEAGSSSAVHSTSNIEDVAVSKDSQELDAGGELQRRRESTNSAERHLKFGSNQKMSRSKREQPEIAIDMVVILPAGHHGVPQHHIDSSAKDDSPCGPTSLLECWQSGGNCHCGGWDTECGLSVLKASTIQMHKPRTTIALTNRDRINWITPQKPLHIFTQGCKQKRLLMLEMIQTGLFSLSFQARFSPLQAFATVVAIFHEQITHK